MRCRWCRCEGQAWGMRGAVPPAAWAFAILVASDMLFLRRFPGEFAPFAFSQCVIGFKWHPSTCVELWVACKDAFRVDASEN